MLDCVFSEPATADGASRRALCTTPAGARSRSASTTRQGGAGDGIRVFAGARWDPFIMDARAALETIATGQLAFTDHGSIFLDGKNVLSLVVEIDCARFLGGADAGRRRRRDPDARRVQRPDRTGGPARGEEHDAGARSSSTR